MRYSVFSVNDHYPNLDRTVPELYQQAMLECELAERLGYDTFFCAEHHFHEYGVVPDPAVFLSALAQRTKRIRLGTAVSTITFHDPRRLAESYAMLDMMSGGRLVYGVGSGYLAHEFAGFGREPAEKRERFNENLTVLRRLMAGETLGASAQGHGARLNVLPHQGRVPPIYVAVLAREGAYHVGRQKNALFSVPYASCKDFADIGAMFAEYRKGQEEAGVAPSDDDHVFTFHTYVASSDEEAKAQAKEAYDRYVATRLYAKRHLYEDVIASGLCLFGSVQTVAQKVLALHAMGIRHIATLQNFGALQAQLVERSMTLFAREVMPALISETSTRSRSSCSAPSSAALPQSR